MEFSTTVTTGIPSILLATLLATVGSFLTIDLLPRVHSGRSASRVHWLLIVSIVAASSAWATQVLLLHASDIRITIFGFCSSLLAGLATTCVGLFVAMKAPKSVSAEIGGAFLGAGNFVCLSLLVHHAAGTTDKPAWVGNIGAMAVCALLSASAFSISLRTEFRFTKALGTTLLMATLSMLLYVVPSAPSIVPQPMLEWSLVLFLVGFVMASVLGCALATYNIERQSRADAVNALKNYSECDRLTGLSNRDSLKSHVADLIGTTDRSTTKFAVLAFNLNRFRLVNDVHGSETGDHILKAVAGRLQASLGPDEFVARVSGDEFYAVKGGLHRKGDATAFAQKILDIIAEPITWRSARLDITARIGVSMFPNSSERVDDLISQADIAMCRAKELADGKIAYFDESVDKAKRDLNALAIDLQTALDDDEFEIFYQPQHSANTHDLIGFEALIRWNHPLRGMVSPADFIPLAEKTGLIHEIGAWVIKQACLQAALWGGSMKIAVNVSSIQIMRHDLPDIVRDALSRSGIDPNRLELEITESGIVADERHALAILNRIKELGCLIAMDDFGTGFSSLSTFKKFPFDKIKIDRAFIGDLTTSPQSKAIVAATVGVGRPLGIKVLAEGVEHREQLAILTEIGCDEVQGFYFGRPVAARDADAIFRAAKGSQAPRATDNVVEFKACNR